MAEALAAQAGKESEKTHYGYAQDSFHDLVNIQAQTGTLHKFMASYMSAEA